MKLIATLKLAGSWLQKLRFVNGKSGDFFAKAKKNY